MTKRGEAGRALGAALMSSLLGALIGAGALALAIPIVRPLVLTFGSPELFMLAIIGISCITSLSGAGARGQIKGFAMGLLGLLLSTIGQERQSGSLRFDMGMMYLWDGLDFVPVLVGIFAIPEIVDLAIRGTAIAGERQPENLKAGVMEGVKDTFRHFWLVFRCSIIGVFVGILPGAGGGVAQWMAYAHSVQSAKNAKEREGFGKGDVRGVLGPGAANNSKEGGELIPTIAFGVPGSGAMAILLGGFLIMGIIPGPDMLTKHLAITFSMVWTLVIANVITVVLCLLVLDQLAKVTFRLAPPALCPGLRAGESDRDLSVHFRIPLWFHLAAAPGCHYSDRAHGDHHRLSLHPAAPRSPAEPGECIKVAYCFASF